MATPRNQSVFKAFAMLKAFRNPEEWLTSSELSRRANLPEASGYRLVQTLEEIGAVIRGPRGRYRPGMLLVSLGRNVIVPELLQGAGQQIASEVARKMNVTVHLGLLERGTVTYVIKATSPSAFQTQTRAGAQLEAHCSAIGKVLLAALPAEELDEILLDGQLVSLTAHTITDTAVLRRHLDDVRVRGWATDERELRLDMSCVAVPVRDDRGRAVAGISASESVEAMTPERQAELLEALTAAAAALGGKVCPQGPKFPLQAAPVPRPARARSRRRASPNRPDLRPPG